MRTIKYMYINEIILIKCIPYARIVGGQWPCDDTI